MSDNAQYNSKSDTVNVLEAPRPPITEKGASTVVVVETDEEHQGDPQAQQEFSTIRKCVIFSIVTVVQMMNQLSINGLYPVFPAIRTDLHTTETVTNATAASFAFITGVLPSLWASYSNIYGRRPIYAVSNLITALGNLGSALSVNIGMLIAFRGITAIGASACVAMGAGVVTEVFNDNERGRALSWNNALPITMTAVSPMISGLLTQYFGWRSVFWFYTICYGVLFICVIFFLPETKKNLKGDTQKNKLRQLVVVNPASSLKLLRYPNLLLTSIYMGLMFFVNYAVNTSFTWAYSNQYGFNAIQVGLCYMLGAFGYCVGAYTAGSLSDRMYCRRVQKAKENNEHVYPEMRLSKASLAPAAVLMVGGYAAYGWCIQANAHFIFGMLMQMFAQLGMMIWVCFLTVYAIQCFPDRGASAQACFQIVKNLFIVVAILAVIDLQDLLGHGVLYSICGGILLLASSFVIYVQANTERWQRIQKEHPL